VLIGKAEPYRTGSGKAAIGLRSVLKLMLTRVLTNANAPDKGHWSRRQRFLLPALILLGACASAATATPPAKTMLAQAKRAVVIVTTYDDQGKALLQGSGFFVTSRQVVTNLHVIDQANQIRIETFAGQTLPVASVVATDANSDLALLQLDAPPPNTGVLQIEYLAPDEGDAIVVLSNPRGSRWQTTVGKVGASWNLAGTGKRLQITAGLRPGSSGGPVLNQQGRVIGIAAMHIRSTDELDFAIPAAELKHLLKRV
jgi:S1-C subfamily serine protease